MCPLVRITNNQLQRWFDRESRGHIDAVLEIPWLSAQNLDNPSISIDTAKS